LGFIKSIDWMNQKAEIQIEPEFLSVIEREEAETGVITGKLDIIDKPLDVFYEQIAKRSATRLSAVDQTEEKQQFWYEQFYEELAKLHFIPAGRVLYGAGSGTDVTYLNCYVMPYVKDSREGISNHRKQVMEIMSRGGGVGTN